ncbi:ABC transporter permease subunit [Bacillaceae bacterium]
MKENIWRGAAWGLLLLFAVLLVLPLVPLVLWSLAKDWQWPSLLPERWGVDAWRYVFSPSGKAWEGMFHSWIVALLTLLFNLLLGFPAARALAQRDFFGRGIVFALLLSPLFIPYLVSVMGLHALILPLNGIPVHVRVALAHVIPTLPYFIAVLWFRFRLLGTKLQEAARSLGASTWQIFFWVELPQMYPALALASVLVALISLSQYLPTWIMSGGTLLTLPLLIFPFAGEGNAAIVAAYSLWFMWPILALIGGYFLFFRDRWTHPPFAQRPLQGRWRRARGTGRGRRQREAAVRANDPPAR